MIRGMRMYACATIISCLPAGVYLNGVTCHRNASSRSITTPAKTRGARQPTKPVPRIDAVSLGVGEGLITHWDVSRVNRSLTTEALKS